MGQDLVYTMKVKKKGYRNKDKHFFKPQRL